MVAFSQNKVGDKHVIYFEDVDFDNEEQKKQFIEEIEENRRIVERKLALVMQELDQQREELARHKREEEKLSFLIISKLFSIYSKKRIRFEVKDGIICLFSDAIETDSKLSKDAKLYQIFNILRRDVKIDMTLFPIIYCNSKGHWYWIKTDLNGYYANRESLGDGLTQELAIQEVKKMIIS
jgi:hypothetical protein